MISFNYRLGAVYQPQSQIQQLHRTVFVLDIGIKADNSAVLQSFLPGIQIGENAVDFFAHFATQISDYVTVIRRTFLVGSIVAVKRPQNLCGSIDKFVAEEGAGTRQVVVEVIHNAVFIMRSIP